MRGRARSGLLSAMSPRPLARATLVAACLLLPLTTAACGDDDDAATDTTTTEASTEADETTTEADVTTTEADAGGDEVAITGVDYAFEGVPASVPAGTRLSFTNDSDAEVHEIVAVPLGADETRPIEEIVADPAGIGALLGGGPPTAVIVASPGGDQPGAVVGDGTLAEPGRYALICTIPTGADPDEYLAAAAAAQGGPPDVAGGPPHFVNGMVAEVEVTP
jgi:hypothetical protein